MLPDNPKPPEKEFPATFLIYGDTKIGKTFSLTKLKDNLLIDLEKGALTYEALRVTVSTYDEFKKLSQELAKNRNKYKFITIDTLDMLIEWLEIEVVKEWNDAQKKVKTPEYVKVYSEIPYGKGYDLVRLKARRWINFLRSVAPHLILIAHVRRTIVATDTMVEIDDANIDLTGKLKTLIFKDMDLISYAFRRGNQLKLSFKHSKITGGGRFPRFDDKIITLSEKKENGEVEVYWDQIFTTKQLKEDKDEDKHEHDKVDVSGRRGDADVSEDDKGDIHRQDSEDKTF